MVQIRRWTALSQYQTPKARRTETAARPAQEVAGPSTP